MERAQPSLVMKKVLTLSALVLVGITAAAELAATAGLAVPAVINTQNLLIAFVVGLTALIVATDYAPRRMLALPASTTPAQRTAGLRRSGYSIRRGAEAARLAPPPARVTLFPKSAAAGLDRAA